MAARSVGYQDHARPGSSCHPSDCDDRPLVRTRRCSFYRRLILNSLPTGYDDLITPFFDAEFALSRHNIRAGGVHYMGYGGEHMMYVNELSRIQLLDDVRKLIQAKNNKE